jgi:hypothetical protein
VNDVTFFQNCIINDEYDLVNFIFFKINTELKANMEV